MHPSPTAVRQPQQKARTVVLAALVVAVIAAAVAVTIVVAAIVVVVMVVVRLRKKMMARLKSSFTSTAFQKRLRVVSALALLHLSSLATVRAA